MNMTGANSMKMDFNEKDFKNIQQYNDAEVPRKNGNFRYLTKLNGNTITEFDIFNTLYYEFFPKEKIDDKEVKSKHKKSQSVYYS